MQLLRPYRITTTTGVLGGELRSCLQEGDW